MQKNQPLDDRRDNVGTPQSNQNTGKHYECPCQKNLRVAELSREKQYHRGPVDGRKQTTAEEQSNDEHKTFVKAEQSSEYIITCGSKS